MIDLASTKDVLKEVVDLVDRLDGLDLDERESRTDQSKGDARRERALISQDLQLLATRLELATGLVRVEYWHARGFTDPLHPDR